MNLPPRDCLLEMLSRLPAATPDAGRSARVRSQCQAAAARGRRTGATSSRAAEWAVVGSFCLLYLMAILRDVAALYSSP